MLERLNTLWFGNQLKYTEQLCIASARAVGHQFRIYSYDPEALKGVPSGVELRDARELLPEERLLRYSDTGAVALGSDLFRYAMLAKGLGYWVDLDLCFLRPLDFTDPYVFGWEY